MGVCSDDRSYTGGVMLSVGLMVERARDVLMPEVVCSTGVFLL